MEVIALLLGQISIHAPREGGRLKFLPQEYFVEIISIHAPREGGDWDFCAYKTSLVEFQSTPPARGATA